MAFKRHLNRYQRAQFGGILRLSAPRMRDDEELRLILECQTLGAGSDASRDIKLRIVASNFGLIKHVAKRYAFAANVPIEDLISEGVIGMMMAVDSYDDVKSKFSWYASKCMQYKMLDAIRLSSTINVPWEATKIKVELMRRYLKENGTMPTSTELRRMLSGSGMDYWRTCSVLQRKSSKPVESLIDPASMEEVEQPGAEELDEIGVMLKLSALRPDVSEMVMARFGIHPYDRPHMLNEIGDAVSLSSERIRQLIERGMSQMRDEHPERRGDEYRRARFWAGWVAQAKLVRSLAGGGHSL